MNRLFILAVLVVACVVAGGFYFGYFRINAESADGSSHLTFTVDQKKIQGDGKSAVEKVQGQD